MYQGQLVKTQPFIHCT